MTGFKNRYYYSGRSPCFNSIILDSNRKYEGELNIVQFVLKLNGFKILNQRFSSIAVFELL